MIAVLSLDAIIISDPSGLNDAELTLAEIPGNICNFRPLFTSQTIVVSDATVATFVPSGLNEAE